MKGLSGLFYDSASRYPDNVFVRCPEHAWTYGEAYSKALAVCGFLLRYGISRGERVIILCDNGIQYIAALFGVLAANAIAVPVNPLKMTDSLEYIIGKCSPGLILACNSTIERLDKIKDKLETEIVNIDRIFSRNVCADGRSCSSEIDINSDSEIDINIDIDDGDTAMILFTSGTTAWPKGVALTHGGLLANTEAIVEYLHLTGGDSVFMTLPFTYSYGNSVLLTHARVGAAIVIENSTAYPYKVLEGIRNRQVSGFSTVGSYINLMLKAARSCGAGCDAHSCGHFFDALRYITFAGEATCNEDVLYINREFPHIKAYVMYGQTEAGARLSYLDPELLPDKIGSIGKGLCNVELKVVNDEGKFIMPGESGEIIACGPNIMKGYWEEPQATAEVLRGGWLYTGDIATVDEDGFIYIKGRKSDVIKHMGHRISPAEIENVINGCAGIRESAVIESEDDGIPVIKVFIVPEREPCMEFPAEHFCDEIRKKVCSRLPVYMRPQIFELIDRLPRTDSGKIKRSVLRTRSGSCAE